MREKPKTYGDLFALNIWVHQQRRLPRCDNHNRKERDMSCLYHFIRNRYHASTDKVFKQKCMKIPGFISQSILDTSTKVDDTRTDTKSDNTKNVPVKYSLSYMACRAIVAKQDEFRVKLLKKFDHKCAITGCAIDSLLQVARIIPYDECVETNMRLAYNAQNGLIIERNLHHLFMTYMISINPDTYRLEMTNEVIDDGYYGGFVGVIIKQLMNNYMGKELLTSHYAKFCQRKKEMSMVNYRS
jgi:hypothetical protein